MVRAIIAAAAVRGDLRVERESRHSFAKLQGSVSNSRCGESIRNKEKNKATKPDRLRFFLTPAGRNRTPIHISIQRTDELNQPCSMA